MKNYNKIFTIVFSVLTIILVILVFLNSDARLHIRSIEISGDSASAEFLETQIKVYFNNPIQRTEEDKPIDFKKLITFEPSINFNTSWNGNTLFIIPRDTLTDDTDYKLTVSQGIKDVYGNSIDKNFEFNFKTKPLKFTYLQKNFPDDKDKVISRNVKTKEEEVILEEENITKYAVNKDFAVVVLTNADKTTNIKTFDLNSKVKRDLSLKEINISGLDISEKLNVFIYLSQEVTPMGQYLQPKSNIVIKIYDLTNQVITDYKIKGNVPDVITAQFSPDGSSILYRSAESEYYLTNLGSEDEPISIGKFTGTGGFNKSGTKIVFSNYDPLRTYGSFPFITVFTTDRKEYNVTTGFNYVLDPVFMHTTDDILFGDRYKELLGAQGMFSITKAKPGEDETKYTFSEFLTAKDSSLELPKPSWDDKYILLEKYNEVALLDYQNQRSFINQRKPYKADLLIYDTEKNEIVDEIKDAIDGFWQR